MTIIADSELAEELIRERQKKGLDKPDEVWDGEYIIMPNPDIEHQILVARLIALLDPLVRLNGMGLVVPGTNISDRPVNWKENYRIPDVAVFLKENPAENRDTFWYGGPDFAIEIVSPDDLSREKLDFYASVNTRELLIIDRNPWSLELFRLQDGAMRLVGQPTLESGEPCRSEVLPLEWSLVAAEPRPQLRILHRESGEQWTI